jgi:hypothetical protein
MSIELNKDTWIWVIVQNPEKKASFLGQHDTENDIKFIPAFLEKEAALMCMNQLTKDESDTYEPQTLFYDDLLRYCNENVFLIYLLDNKGRILDKIAP